jgi:hypothetical protein
VLRSPASDSWAYLRAARFAGRPGHADQLHLDLWWRGVNVARDPGTYRYNGPPPWDNALAGTAHHNTVTLDGRDQMTRAGRFLWLGWAQAEVIDQELDDEGRLTGLSARHDGYQASGALHLRRVTAWPDGSWTIKDEVSPAGRPANRTREACLHWLLPDWPWDLEEAGGEVRLVLTPSGGTVTLSVRSEPDGAEQQAQLVRAGVPVAGEGTSDPTRGWYSPTYDRLEPALSLSVTVTAPLPIRLHTRWTFSGEPGQVQR